MKKMDSSEIMEKIQPNVSTKDDVQALLGPCDSVSYTDSAKEIWRYVYEDVTPHASNFVPVVNMFSSGHDVKTKEFVVIFDDKGFVMSRTMRESKSVQKMGLMGKE